MGETAVSHERITVALLKIYCEELIFCYAIICCQHKDL